MIVLKLTTYRLALTTVKYSMKFKVSSNRLQGQWLLCRLHWAIKSHSLLGLCQGSTKTCFSVTLGVGLGRWSSHLQNNPLGLGASENTESRSFHSQVPSPSWMASLDSLSKGEEFILSKVRKHNGKQRNSNICLASFEKVPSGYTSPSLERLLMRVHIANCKDVYRWHS